jgi:hypothetical protein
MFSITLNVPQSWGRYLVTIVVVVVTVVVGVEPSAVLAALGL